MQQLKQRSGLGPLPAFDASSAWMSKSIAHAEPVLVAIASSLSFLVDAALSSSEDKRVKRFRERKREKGGGGTSPWNHVTLLRAFWPFGIRSCHMLPPDRSLPVKQARTDRAGEGDGK